MLLDNLAEFIPGAEYGVLGGGECDSEDSELLPLTIF